MALADASPRAAIQRKLSAQLNQGARVVQRKPVNANTSFNADGVAQLKTDVKQDLNDAKKDEETSSKKIATPTLGTKWFRFARGSDHVIESFSNNLYKGVDAGPNPVSYTIDLSDNKEGVEDSDIPELTRAKHFALGDAMIGKNKGYRTGKYTWHHKTDPYKMELVDMYTHGGFFHYGGFSQWQEGMDDDDD